MSLRMSMLDSSEERRIEMKAKIAEELNLSEKTVEHQISKALKTLRGKKDDFLADFFYILPFIHGRWKELGFPIE